MSNPTASVAVCFIPSDLLTFWTSPICMQGVLPGLKGPVSLSDSGRGVKTTVEHTAGWTDYVLWNPYGNEGMGYDSFVCVESGAVTEPVTVAPGADWVGEMKIRAS